MSEEEQRQLERLLEEYRGVVGFFDATIKTFMIALPIALIAVMVIL